MAGGVEAHTISQSFQTHTHVTRAPSSDAVCSVHNVRSGHGIEENIRGPIWRKLWRF